MRFEDLWVVVCVLCGFAAAAGAGEVRRLDDFETGKPKWGGDFTGGFVGEHASRGKRCLKVTFPAGVEYPGIEAVGIDLDWSGFEFLKLDVFNPQAEPVDLDVRIDDDRSTGYSSRYTGEFLVVNGFSTIEIPISRMTAGRRNLDPSKPKKASFST